MIDEVRWLAGVAALTMSAPAQDPELGEVLARFPRDGIPASIHRLHGPEHDEAIAAFARVGPRAHRYLVGALRVRKYGRFDDFAAAFSGFGPQSAWTLPALMDCLRGDNSWPMTLELIERLGPNAAPAVPFLREHGSQRYRRLASEIEEIPRPADPVAIATPFIDSVDQTWREPLLSVLRDRRSRAQWWPALQAMIAIDDHAAVDAALVLATHAIRNADDQQPRALLEAMRCWFAADAIVDLASLVELPDALLVPELRRAVLAHSAPRHDAVDAEHLKALASHGDPAVRRLARIDTLLMRLRMADTEVPEMFPGAGAHDPDPAVREVADLLVAAEAARVARLFATPIGNPATLHVTLRRIAALPAAQLVRLPSERVRELIALGAPPDRTSIESDSKRVGDALITSATRNRSSGYGHHEAGRVLQRLIEEVPMPLLALEEPTADETRGLVRAAVNTRAPAPELHEWLLSNLDPALVAQGGRCLPIGLAPSLAKWLDDPARRERAVEFLRLGCRYVVWIEAAPDFASALEQITFDLSPERRADALYVLAVGGEPGQRSLEALSYDSQRTTEQVSELAKAWRTSAQRTAPRASAVMRMFEHGFEAWRGVACQLARYVVDDPKSMALALVAHWIEFNEAQRRDSVRALGALGQESTLPLIEMRFLWSSGVQRIETAVAMLEIDPAGQDGLDCLRRATRAGSQMFEVAWHRISWSPAVSTLFLPEVLTRIDALDPEDWRNTSRMFNVVRSAAKHDRDAALEILQTLMRHRSSRVAQMAKQAHRQLTR